VYNINICTSTYIIQLNCTKRIYYTILSYCNSIILKIIVFTITWCRPGRWNRHIKYTGSTQINLWNYYRFIWTCGRRHELAAFVVLILFCFFFLHSFLPVVIRPMPHRPHTYTLSRDNDYFHHRFLNILC